MANIQEILTALLSSDNDTRDQAEVSVKIASQANLVYLNSRLVARQLSLEYYSLLIQQQFSSLEVGVKVPHLVSTLCSQAATAEVRTSGECRRGRLNCYSV